MHENRRDSRIVARIPIAIGELLKHRRDRGRFHRFLRRAHDHEQNLDESLDKNLIAILSELRTNLLRFVFSQPQNGGVLLKRSTESRGVVVEVLLGNAHVGVHGERVLLPRLRRCRVLDLIRQICDQAVQLVARLAVFFRLADAIDRLMNDRAEISAPEIVDHVIPEAEVFLSGLEDGEETVEIFRSHVWLKRQLAKPVAEERKEKGVVVPRPAQDGHFVKKNIRRSDRDRHSFFTGRRPAPFEQALIGFNVRRVRRVVETAGGQRLFDL